MFFANLASGSAGNVSLISSGTTKILIDAGISRKRIIEGLKQHGTDLSEIDAILVTHEHSDHIQALSMIEKKYDIPIYGTNKTLIYINSVQKFNEGTRFISIEPDKGFNIGDIDVRAFSISHDAVDPVGYRISSLGKDFALCTDVGYFDDNIVSNLLNLDGIYIEANHDIKMLEVGPYPYPLKRRVRGREGHLSNEECGQLICSIASEKLKHIVLAHISQNNNYPELAREAVKNEINSSEIRFNAEDFNIYLAKQDGCGASFEI